MKRDPVLVIVGALVLVLTVLAFAASIDHIRSVADANGQHGWLATIDAILPEVSVLLSVLLIGRTRGTGRRPWVAMVYGGAAVVLTIAANLATANLAPGQAPPKTDLWGYVFAVEPALVALGAASVLKVLLASIGKDGQAVKPQVRAPMSAKAKPPATPPTGIPAPDVTAVVRPAHVRTDTKPKRTPDNATKTLALHAVRTQPGRTQDDIAREFGVTARTLLRWITEAEHADQEVAA